MIESMMKKVSKLLICVGLSSLSFSLNAQPEVLAYEQLDGLLSTIETMTADVSQLIVESDGGVLERSDVQMKLKRPYGFYWETISPFPELIVTDGDLLWNYQPDLEQVVIEPWDASRSELAAQLLSGNTDNLVEEYTLTRSNQDESEYLEFVLVPRNADSIYRRITLTFNRQLLDMIHVESDNGQRTVWQFSGIALNNELPDQLFVFQPPAGIEIIQNTYVQ